MAIDQKPILGPQNKQTSIHGRDTGGQPTRARLVETEQALPLHSPNNDEDDSDGNEDGGTALSQADISFMSLNLGTSSLDSRSPDVSLPNIENPFLEALHESRRQSDVGAQQVPSRSALADITPLQDRDNINVENHAPELEAQQEVLTSKQIKQRGKLKSNKAAAAAIVGQKAIEDLKTLKKKYELLEKENVTLLLNNERLRDKNADAEKRAQVLRGDVKTLQDEIKSWKLQKREWDEVAKSHERKDGTVMDHKVSKLEEEKEQWAEEKKDLLQEIGELEYDRDLKAPLIQHCVDIRARLYEQERVSPLHSTILKAELEQDKIDRGHAAAHGGDFEADRALFKLGLLDDIYVRAFQSLYCTGKLKPQDFTWTWSTPLIEAMNVHFTLNAGRGNHEVLGSRRERFNAVTHHNKILELHERLSPEQFENNWEVHAELTKLKNLAKKMTDSFRQHQGEVLRKDVLLRTSGAAAK